MPPAFRDEGCGLMVARWWRLPRGLTLELRLVLRAEDAQRTPTQRHVSPSILIYEDKLNSRPDQVRERAAADETRGEPRNLPRLESAREGPRAPPRRDAGLSHTKFL